MSRLEAFMMGYEVVGWNLNSGDWYESQSSVMGKYLLEMVSPGGIVLFHDTLYDKGTPAHGPIPNIHRGQTVKPCSTPWRRCLID